VSHPLLESHPDHALARSLLSGGSGLVTIRLAGGDDRALRFMRELRLVWEASSLGGVESLASAPHNTSHLTVSPARRRALGILPGTVRLSLGIEDAADLIDDIDGAIATTTVGAGNGGMHR
jgi:cystathionine beta-lyase/cystathionine gamma-synthase